MKVGEYLGGIYKRVLPDGKDEWYLLSGKITKIVSNTKGTKVYSKEFYPLDIEEIESNTNEMENAEGYIYTREVMLLSDSLRSRCERWIKWANDNPDKCKIC